jgi:hypothetical protein
MPREIPNVLQSLHFDTLTLSPTKVNWVERWSKAQGISLIGPMMWVSSIRDGKMQLGARVMVSKGVQ